MGNLSRFQRTYAVGGPNSPPIGHEICAATAASAEGTAKSVAKTKQQKVMRFITLGA
jgi:hypothetical protein